MFAKMCDAHPKHDKLASAKCMRKKFKLQFILAGYIIVLIRAKRFWKFFLFDMV